MHSLEGNITDYGDLIHQERWIVKGLRPPQIVIRIGVPIETEEEDRKVKSSTYVGKQRKVDAVMDLQADKKVLLSVQYTDEVGNATDTPDNATVSWTVSDPNVLNLTDNGDGTAVAAAVGTPGTANVHVNAEFENMVAQGDLQVVVVTGLAERVNVVAGEIQEVTPDSTGATPGTSTEPAGTEPAPSPEAVPTEPESSTPGPNLNL